MVILLVVSSSDVASVKLGESLLKMTSWNELANSHELEVYTSGSNYLWWKKESALFEDHIDEKFSSAIGIVPDEVLFLSRHSAASGKPCLTVHPIGVLDGDDLSPQFGGLGGYCPPPGPTFSAWMNLLDAILLRLLLWCLDLLLL